MCRPLKKGGAFGKEQAKLIQTPCWTKRIPGFQRFPFFWCRTKSTHLWIIGFFRRCKSVMEWSRLSNGFFRGAYLSKCYKEVQGVGTRFCFEMGVEHVSITGNFSTSMIIGRKGKCELVLILFFATHFWHIRWVHDISSFETSRLLMCAYVWNLSQHLCCFKISQIFDISKGPPDLFSALALK